MAEIDLKSLNPDADGDGKVSQQEKEIYAALKAADIDGSGSIGQAELYAVIGKLVGEQKRVVIFRPRLSRGVPKQ